MKNTLATVAFCLLTFTLAQDGTAGMQTRPFVIGINPQVFLRKGTEQYLLESGARSIRAGRHGSTVIDDGLIAWAAQNNIPVLFSTGLGHVAGITTSPDARQRYADIAKADVVKFGRIIEYAEVWNEWNGGMGLPCKHRQPPCNDGALYTDLLCRVYRSIKSVRPDILIMGGAVAGADRKFIGKMLAAGAANCMDILSVHVYIWAHRQIPASSTPEFAGQTFAKKLTNLDAFVRSTIGKSIPIAVTEAGMSANRTDPWFAKQAPYLTSAYTEGMKVAAVRGIWWYALPSVGKNAHQQGYGLLDDTLAPKPAFRAYQAIAKSVPPPCVPAASGLK